MKISLLMELVPRHGVELFKQSCAMMAQKITLYTNYHTQEKRFDIVEKTKFCGENSGYHVVVMENQEFGLPSQNK